MKTPQDVTRVSYSRLDSELLPELQSTESVKVSVQEVSKRVVSSAIQEEKLDRNAQGVVDFSAIEKKASNGANGQEKYYSRGCASGFWSLSHAEILKLLGSEEQERSHPTMQNCKCN